LRTSAATTANPFAMLASARCLNGGIECQQVGLVGNVVHDADLGGDLLHGRHGLADCLTAVGASRLALVAMPSVTLALSLFWLMLALITSICAVVSSTLAACSLAAWLRIVRWR
jgi:hypothetical protein